MDGRVQAPGEAKLDVFDHGFLYGDSIYETVRTFGGRVFALEPHLDRLERSARRLELELPYDRDGFTRIIAETALARPRGAEAGIRLVVTRGIGPLGLTGVDCRPSVLVYGWSLPDGPHPRAKDGVSAIVATVRRNPVEALDPAIKSGNYLNNILAAREAADVGAFEAILLGIDGSVREGTTSNVFWVRNGRIETSEDHGILSGVTRRIVLDLIREAELPIDEGAHPATALREADEIFITSSLKGVMPVVSLDGERVRDATPGPVTSKLRAEYDALCVVPSPYLL